MQSAKEAFKKDKDAAVFAQLFCSRSDEAQRSRNKQILSLVCLSLFGLMLVQIVSGAMMKYNQMQKHIYNFYFAQPKEFTLCLKVYNSQISVFLKDVHQENQGNFGKQFQNHVCKEVQNALRQIHQQVRGSEAPRDFFDISLCQLSYRNKQTIDFLTERGNAIRARDVDKVKEYNRQILKKKIEVGRVSSYVYPARVYIFFTNLKAAQFA